MNTNLEALRRKSRIQKHFSYPPSLFFTHSDYVSDMREAGKKKMNSPNNAQQEKSAAKWTSCCSVFYTY